MLQLLKQKNGNWAVHNQEYHRKPDYPQQQPMPATPTRHGTTKVQPDQQTANHLVLWLPFGAPQQLHSAPRSLKTRFCRLPSKKLPASVWARHVPCLPCLNRRRIIAMSPQLEPPRTAWARDRQVLDCLSTSTVPGTPKPELPDTSTSVSTTGPIVGWDPEWVSVADSRLYLV